MTIWTRIPSLGNLSAYADAVQKFPMLTLEEEITYGTIKDEQAKLKLVLSHLKLVLAMATKASHHYSSHDTSDLIQEGNIALMAAANNFDPTQGRFASFAITYIKNALMEYNLFYKAQIRTVKSKPQRKIFYNYAKVIKKLYAGQDRIHMTEKAAQEIAQELGVSTKDVSEFFHNQITEMSLNESDSDADSWITPDMTYEPVAVLEQLDKENRINIVTEAMGKLDERSQEILKQRYMLDKQIPLRVLSEQFNVSMERIRQIELLAIKKIRKELEIV